MLFGMVDLLLGQRALRRCRLRVGAEVGGSALCTGVELYLAVKYDFSGDVHALCAVHGQAGDAPWYEPTATHRNRVGTR